MQILNRPTKPEVSPVVVHKLLHSEPKVTTVYVDRPLPSQTEVVEVEKIVKQFIQPDRPIVNRIIECSGSPRQQSQS